MHSRCNHFSFILNSRVVEDASFYERLQTFAHRSEAADGTPDLGYYGKMCTTAVLGSLYCHMLTITRAQVFIRAVACLTAVANVSAASLQKEEKRERQGRRREREQIALSFPGPIP